MSGERRPCRRARGLACGDTTVGASWRGSPTRTAAPQPRSSATSAAGSVACAPARLSRKPSLLQSKSAADCSRRSLKPSKTLRDAQSARRLGRERACVASSSTTSRNARPLRRASPAPMHVAAITWERAAASSSRSWLQPLAVDVPAFVAHESHEVSPRRKRDDSPGTAGCAGAPGRRPGPPASRAPPAAPPARAAAPQSCR